MARKQEDLSDYFQMAREIAKVEKEQGIEQWDNVHIEREGDKECEYILLYNYDLPRRIAEKFEWAIRWRAARLQCLYPRYTVRITHAIYKKVRGVNIGMQKDINIFTAEKAQYTKQKRNLDKYISWQKANNMFFDENSDEKVVKAKAKLARRRESIEQAETRLIEIVKQYKSQQNGSVGT